MYKTFGVLGRYGMSSTTALKDLRNLADSAGAWQVSIWERWVFFFFDVLHFFILSPSIELLSVSSVHHRERLNVIQWLSVPLADRSRNLATVSILGSWSCRLRIATLLDLFCLVQALLQLSQEPLLPSYFVRRDQPGVSPVWMLRTAGEAEAKQALGPEEYRTRM
jgi:hypothetical protein